MRTAILFPKTLLGFFAFVALMLIARAFFTGELHYLFLVWNIFLAWIPFMISSFFETNKKNKIWVQALLFCSWLAFFPNALYIVTDLIHLDKESIVPKWFDAVLIFSASITGLMMAFISLYRAELFLHDRINKKLLPFVILFILFLGSFGVYLGRFLRWNSWDIVSNPLQLFTSIADRFLFPLDHPQTWNVTIVFTAFFYLLYLAIKKMPGYLSQANI